MVDGRVAERSGRARPFLASVCTLVAVVGVVLNPIVAGLPALAGFVLAVFGAGRADPYRTLNRALCVVCGLLVLAAVLVTLLLLTVSTTTTTSTSHPAG